MEDYEDLKHNKEFDDIMLQLFSGDSGAYDEEVETYGEDLTEKSIIDTLEYISYYTGGVSMKKCYTLVDKNKLPEIQRMLELKIRPDLGKYIVAYGECGEYLTNKAKLENKSILELTIHDDRLLKTYNIGESKRYKGLLDKLLSIHPELKDEKDITDKFISYAMNNILPKPSGVIKIKDIPFDTLLKGIVKYRVAMIVIKELMIIERIRVVQ